MILAMAAIFPFPSGAQGTDTWTKVVGNNTMPLGDGFGDGGIANTNNKGVEALESYNGYVFAAVGQNHTGSGNPASVWYTSDLLNWTNLQIGLSASTSDIYYMDSDTNGIFFGTGNTNSADIWKSADGLTWSLFNGTNSGFNRTHNTAVLVGLQGASLYAGTVNMFTGAQVWERPADGSANWTKVLDFGTGSGITTGVQTNMETTYLYSPPGAPGVMFFAAEKLVGGGIVPGFASLYQSSDGGATWQKNAAVGCGFGDTNNEDFAALVEFNDYLYVTTGNPAEGGQLWRTPVTNATNWSSTTPWEQVVSGGFGNTNNIELHRIIVACGNLWVSFSGKMTAQVWRSADGVNWVQSNVNGFAATNNANAGGYAALASLTCANGNEFVAWGGTWHNPTNTNIEAAQVWETTVLAPPSLTLQFTGGYPLLSLSGMSGGNFVVQYSSNLAATNWMNLLSLTNLSTNPYQFSDPSGVGQAARFYRAIMQ